MRQRTTRHTSSHREPERDSRGYDRDLHLDPNETPIKGHGVKRKTVNKSASKPIQPKPTPSVPTRSSVVRHVARSSSSQSESDHVDSDSCNVDNNVKTVKKSVAGGQNVIKSTDTENDFPTTDFNNDDELNDLNRTGGKYGTVSVSGSTNQMAASDLKLSTAGHPLPVVDWSSHGAIPKSSQSSAVSTSSVKPVLRQKVYKESEKIETDGTPKNRETNHVNGSNNLSQPTTSTRSMVPSTGAVTTPRLSDSEPQHHNQFQPVLSESFEDDLLFDKPSFQSNLSHSHRTQRTPSNGDNGTNNLGLSRGRDGPLKTPQDPSMHPILPAVMPAKSSDLTIFSQRSPARFKSHLYQQELEPPPFPLALVNPTESRPKLARTPPPILTQSTADSQGFSRQHIDISAILEGANDQRKLHMERDAQRNIQKTPEQEHRYQAGDMNVNYNESPIEQLHQEMSPLSTNQWYQTPANFASHIASSVQKSVNISSDQCNEETKSFKRTEENNNRYDKLNTVQSSVEKSSYLQNIECEVEETGLKTVEDNLSEFLPIQKRPGNTNKPAQSLTVAHKDVASRLKSAFSKNETTDQTRTKSTQNNLSSHHGDSGPTVTSDTIRTHSPKSHIHSRQHHKHSSAFSDTDVYKNSHSNNKGRQPNSRSPVSDRSALSKTPVNQKNSHSPVVRALSNNAIIKTEKLNIGSAFSPIHPQPVTTSAISKTTVGNSHKELVHPKPVVSPTTSDPRNSVKETGPLK